MDRSPHETGAGSEATPGDGPGTDAPSSRWRAAAGDPRRLSTRLKAATSDLHRRLERSHFQVALFRGALSRGGYVSLLRSLFEVYHGLEGGLDRNRNHPAVAPLRSDRLRRLPALARDLEALEGAGWRRRWGVVPGALRYRKRLERIAGDRPALLAAHCYVRYLGDLGGGPLLAPRVAELLGHPPGTREGEGLAFYDFGEDADAESLREEYRHRLDRLPLDEAGAAAVIAEAVSAFRRHAAIFRQLDARERAARS